MNILIIQQRNWSIKFGISLAEKLFNKGHKVAAISVKKSTHNILKDNKFIHPLWSHDEIYENQNNKIKYNFSLNDVSDQLGIDSVWELIQSQRNLVKSYDKKYYYSFKQSTSDENIKNYILRLFEIYNEIFEKFKPDIIISPVLNSFLHASINLLCKKKQIPILATTDSKVDGKNIFTNSYLDDEGEFFDYLKSIRRNEIQLDRTEIYKAETFIKNKIKQLKSVDYINTNQKINSRYFFTCIKGFLRSFKFKKKDYPLGSSIDLTSPWIYLRDLFYQHLYNYKSKRFPYNNLEKIDNFAFMPLLLQPEENIDLISTKFNNQIETARQVAMSLPANMTLVVKDHPHMSDKRSTSYLEKIKHLANVKLVDCRIPSWKIFEKAKIVIATSGTTVFEAAILNKYTIQLGKLGTIRMLPNVIYQPDLSLLKNTVMKVLAKNIDLEQTKKEMIQYVSAAIKKGLEVNIWHNSLLKDEKAKEYLIKKHFSEIERLTGLKV